ncbi:MAG TPA: hypothetical protein DCW33_04435 [Proteobacteria bacterium]|nr:hypothetical protein [Pseudomonadota bacterium]
MSCMVWISSPYKQYINNDIVEHRLQGQLLQATVPSQDHFDEIGVICLRATHDQRQDAGHCRVHRLKVTCCMQLMDW